MTAPAKERILPDDLLQRLARELGTPLYVYDVDAVLAQVERLRGFDVVRYAVKANSNLLLLSLLREGGVALDVVSAGEIRRALAAGWSPPSLVLTSDLFDREALALVAEHGISVNLGSADMIEQYAEAVPAPRRRPITLRINPGFGHGHDRKVNTGGASSKHGIWHEELGETVQRARGAGLVVGGLHVHIGSGSDLEHLSRVAEAMEAFALEVGGELDTISAGGGLPVPYRPTDRPLDVDGYTEVWIGVRDRLRQRHGRELAVEVEPGRFLVAEAGLLLAEVRATKRVAGRRVVLVDAGFHTLARPMMYGAYHAISIVGRDGEPRTPAVVAGPLCEAADVMTQTKTGEPDPQLLPEARVGDLACFHDAGAYGASMASNYNSMVLPAEVVVRGGRAALARPRQRMDELLDPERRALEAWRDA